MLKKVGVTIRSEQFSVSDELYNAFCGPAGADDFEDEDEESLEAALKNVRGGTLDQTDEQFRAESFEEADDVLEIFTHGRLRVCDGEVTLSYKETEESGLGTMETTLRYRENTPQTVSMVRFGEVNAAFLFESGKRTKCVYNMPFGSMELTIRTISVDNRLMSDGTLVLDYYIEIRGANAEHKCVTISITTP